MIVTALLMLAILATIVTMTASGSPRATVVVRAAASLSHLATFFLVFYFRMLLTRR